MSLRHRLLEIGFIIAVFLVVAAPAYANMGSTLIVAGYSHLLFLNFIIALIEAIAAVLLLRIKAFRIHWLGQIETEPASDLNTYSQTSNLSVRKAYIPLLLANITSAITGFLILFALSEFNPNTISLDKMRFVLIGFILVTWSLTILIEWPFVRPVIRNTKLTFAKPVFAALMLCIAINTVSYIGLFVMYNASGDASLITQAKYDATASFLKNKPGHVYYVDNESNDVYRMNLDGTGKVLIKGIVGRLMVTPGRKTGFWNLMSSDKKLIESDFSQKTSNMGYRSSTTNGSLERILPQSNFYLRELRNDKKYKYDIERSNGMAFSGLVAIDKKTRKRQNIGLETMFSVGITGDVNLLPDDIIIWNLGERILAYDLKTRTVSQLALGNCPVVTLD